ncbi:MAG TPA: S1/P1 nuclease, partial [Thermoanaerobaculia bacterium]|nr:S1/P1 nuclease [Thermoanaerobaculia bacterium]
AREDRVQALRFLVHFVGDVHQPLHVGRRADRGGNEILVLWFGEPTNLHSVWDGRMIESEELSFTELARFIDHPTPEELAAWRAGGYREWIAESFALRPEVYDLGDRRLGYGYAYEKLPIVRRRLLQAGVRLAGLLETIFAPADSPPSP